MAKPVFIVGMPRSGTTLLSNILNATGEIYFPEETHFFDTYDRFKKRQGRRVNSSFSEYYLSSKNFYFQFLNLKENEVEELKTRVEGADDKTLFIELMTLRARSQGVKNWGEKTPIHVLYLQLILSFFPDARIIHVFRDPRDVVNSIIKNSWSRLSPLYERLSQVNRIAGLTADQEQKSQVLHVKFESFLHQPEGTLRSVCEFCELPYDDKIIDNFHKVGNTNFDLKKEPWKKNNLNPLDVTRAFSWRKEENRFRNRFVSWYLRKSIDSLGYKEGIYPNWFFRNLYLLYICFIHLIRKAKEYL